MPMISLQLDDEDDTEIEKLTDNKSEFIRQAIKEKLGKTDKSIQELTLEVDEIYKKLQEKEEILNKKIDMALEHKEQLRLSEISELEQKKQQEQKENEEFMQKFSNLEQIDEIKNFEYIQGWYNIPNLLPIVEKLRQNGIIIGVVQLRRYLTFKK